MTTFIATIFKRMSSTARKTVPPLTLHKRHSYANKLVDIVIPVYNEAHALPDSIAALDAYLDTDFPYPYRISIVDNGSVDDTWMVAKTMQKLYPSVQALHMDQKGRGRALAYAWSRSDADVLAYMDVDLSTDVSALEPMVMPLLEGRAALATGSRLLPDSRVQRSFKRELISRAYNYLLRMWLRFKTSDAQCGFKAIRADAAKQLLPQVSDTAWFFDTELLAKAEYQKLAIHEVPVTWREDPDSRVNIIHTALDDIRGIRRLRKELARTSSLERTMVATILAVTALLYGIGASKNGYANSFYAAAVQAGTHSWKAFFFGSLDASNYITVDKPPVALWFMEASTRLFGFHSWSMLLPEVLAGVATVYLVYASVRRWFSAPSALLAAAVMALTPVAVLMFGFNNPDAILTLLLTASVYAVIRALGSMRPIRWLAAAGVLTGFAFNTKMLQGLIVMPILGLVYLLCAKPRLATRIKHVAAGGVFLAVSALWWPLLVMATPATNRPYIGSSSNNSIWNLIEGYNGVGRLLGSGTGQGGSGGMGAPAGGAAMPNGGTGMQGGGRGPGGSGFGGSTGIFRMFNSDFGPNIGWFIPLATVSTAYGVWQRRRQRTSRRRAAYLLWGGYLALHIIVFSMVSGVIHPYYPVVMAPAVAALVGMGVPNLLAAFRRGGNAAFLLPLSVALTAITACLLLGYQTSWLPALRWIVLVAGLGSSLILLMHLLQPLKQAVKAALITAVVACLLAPTAYALDTATVAHTGSIPSAGPTGTGMQGSNNETATAESALVSYLLAHKAGAKWLVAVASANESAPIQITSGQPVMAVGGFNGGDNALSVTQLEQAVASGELRYYAVSSSGRGGMGMGGGSNTILSWVTEHGTKVTYGGSQYTLYDLSQ